MEPARTVEILVYELLDLIPNLILALTAFPPEMRSSKKKLTMCIIPLYFLVCICRHIALLHISLAMLMSVIWVGFYLLFYKFCIHAKWSRLLFVILLLFQYSGFTTVLFSHFTYYRLPNAAKRPYSLEASLVYAVVLLFTYPVVYLLVRKKLRPLIPFTENQKIWKLLWMIPATFCLVYYYNLYSNGGIIAYSASINNVIFSSVFSASGLFIIFLVLCLVEDSYATTRLEKENYHLNLHFMQYEKLNSQMEDSRRARHDLRQTVLVIRSYLKSHDLQLLEDYLRQYVDTLPNDTPALYSDDPVLNTLLSYYESRSAAQGIAFQTTIQYSGCLPMTDSDKVVLVGNLLENALEACCRNETGNNRIHFSLLLHGDMTAILIDNTFQGTVIRQGNSFLSSKTQRFGFGIASARRIAEKYGGLIRFETKESEFHTSILVPQGNPSK